MYQRPRLSLKMKNKINLRPLTIQFIGKALVCFSLKEPRNGLQAQMVKQTDNTPCRASTGESEKSLRRAPKTAEP